jgi:hypothetical protein
MANSEALLRKESHGTSKDCIENLAGTRPQKREEKVGAPITTEDEVNE